MAGSLYTITFKTGDGDVKVQAGLGDNLLTLARDAGVSIDAPCAGNGTCGKCRCRLIAGTVDAVKGIHLEQSDFDDGWRLACQSGVCGDAVLLVPAAAGSFRTGIQTADLSTPEELQRYDDAIDAIFSAGIARGRAQQGHGVAIDIGTTTVTAALLSLASGKVVGRASMGNGQIVYGADVINRIIGQARPGGIDKLRHAVREETIIPIIGQLCAQAGIADHSISCCTIAGNTTMEHLFVGQDAQSIRLEPFVPAFLELHGKTAAELGLPFAPDAPVIFAPNVGSYVGGDITAGVLATLMWNDPSLSLFIDLGTNGELVFGNADFMLCCACSAGPAFEGGDIACGMRATKGAIQKCAIDPDTMQPAFDVIGGGVPVGICGSGIIDIVAGLFRAGIISPKGRFVREGQRIRRDPDTGAGAYVLAFAGEYAAPDGTPGPEVFIDETDIDNFIRAKGAIFSAIRSMLGSLDMTVDAIGKVIIAGGIGSGIDMQNAMDIGMLPRLPIASYSYIGNSSLTGACAMLLSQQAQDKVFELARNMTYIELSTHPGYMDEFVAACFLPHTDASLFD